LKDYREIAALVKPNNQLGDERVITSVRAWIERLPNWLLIIDNADTLKFNTQDSSNLYSLIPKGPNGKTLWITRDRKITRSLVDPKGAINVHHMRTEEAEKLLASLIDSCDITKEDPIAVEALLHRLDRLPLAISQAAAYIQRTSTTVEKYTRKLANVKKRWELLEKSHPDCYRQFGSTNSVLHTWQVSVDSLLQESPCAYKILHTIAYFSHRNILLELVKAAARPEEYSEKIEDSVGYGKICGKDDDDDDEEDVLEAVARLEEFSFLRKQKKDGRPSYDMPRLVQEATLYSIARNKDNDGGLHFSKTALEILSRTFPLSDQQNWTRCEDLLPHSLTISSSIEVSQEKPSILTLLVKIWRYLNDPGRSRPSGSITSKVLELHREILGKYPTPTDLYIAAKEGRFEILRLLLDGVEYSLHNKVWLLLGESLVKYNLEDGHWTTSLHFAAGCGQADIVIYLLATGADVNSIDGDHDSVLQAGIEGVVMEFLLSRGANINARGGKFGNALQAATSCSPPEMVQILLKNGAEVNYTGGKHGTSLNAAIEYESLELVRLLLDHGANPKLQDGKRENAVQIATRIGLPEILEALITKM
jgi:ankyrin repeat protein